MQWAYVPAYLPSKVYTPEELEQMRQRVDLRPMLSDVVIRDLLKAEEERFLRTINELTDNT